MSAFGVCARCSRPAAFFVNGIYSCGRDVAATIRQHATTNALGHRWASVQVLLLPAPPSDPSQTSTAVDGLPADRAASPSAQQGTDTGGPQ